MQFALREVRDDVLATTHNRQEPFTYGSLGGSVIPLSKARTSDAAPPPAVNAQQELFNAAMAADTPEALSDFIEKYPSGALAEIARQRLVRLAALMPAPVFTPRPTGPCGAVASLGSMLSRGDEPLSPDELCVS